MPFREQQ